MRILTASILLLALCAPAGAQSPEPDKPPAAKPKQSTKLVTLVGCVASNPSAPGEYTIADKEIGTYRLTGAKMHDYVGHQVQVTGGTKAFHITGGLLPTPNAAAQAGAIDPTPAAATGPGTPGSGPAPEFHVKSVKALPGKCLP